MNFKSPPALQPSDTIGIMAPSSRIAPADIDASTAFLQQRGYDVFIHPQCYKNAPPLADGRFTQYAGTVKEKVDALHDLASDPAIKAVFFATGGQRAITLLDYLDYARIAAQPKIYMGFSDSTVLLNAITARSGLITYHGPTFKRLIKNLQADFNLRLLQGQEKEIPLNGADTIQNGETKGILFGGNMTLLCSLREKDYPDIKDGILFLEDINEELTTFDRNLCMLQRRGILNKIGGLIFGQFTGMLDTGTPFGFSFKEIIAEHMHGLNIPIIANAPFGHDIDLYTFPIGQTVMLTRDSLILQS